MKAVKPKDKQEITQKEAFELAANAGLLLSGMTERPSHAQATVAMKVTLTERGLAVHRAATGVHHICTRT